MIEGIEMNEECKNAFSLDDKVALVTGGATGLGFGISTAMIAAGAQVVIVGRREDVLQEACRRLGTKSDYIRHDITDFPRAHDVIAEVVRRYGRLDIVVNDAGNQFKSKAEDATIEDFQRQLDVHLTGAFAMTQAALPELKRRDTSSVIFISSESGFMGLTFLAGYSASKAGVMGLVRNLASEVSHTGIRFNAIVPGWIETPMFIQSMGKDVERQKKVLGRTPLNRFGTIMDIGWAAVYLASDASKFITGTSIVVDGGALIGF